MYDLKFTWSLRRLNFYRHRKWHIIRCNFRRWKSICDNSGYNGMPQTWLNFLKMPQPDKRWEISARKHTWNNQGFDFLNFVNLWQSIIEVALRTAKVGLWWRTKILPLGPLANLSPPSLWRCRWPQCRHCLTADFSLACPHFRCFRRLSGMKSESEVWKTNSISLSRFFCIYRL